MTSHPVQTQERGLGCDADVGVGAQEPDPQPERPLASRPERSSSFQEIFSSPRNQLLRQSSLQQQVCPPCWLNVLTAVVLVRIVTLMFKTLTCSCFMDVLFIPQRGNLPFTAADRQSKG